MPFIRTSQIEDEVIYLPENQLPNVRTKRRSRRNSSLRRPRGSRCYQWLVLCLTSLSVVTCCMLLAVGFFFIKMSKRQLKSFGMQSIANPAIACIDCTDESYIPYSLLDAVSRTHDDGTSHCCAYNTRELTALLEISMRRKIVESAEPAFNVSNFSLSSASAHVQLLPPLGDTVKGNEVYFTDDLVPVILNDEEIKKDAVNKHVRNITLLQDGFKVLQKGVYYIYSSIHFHVGPGMPCSNLKYKVWQHHIERKGNNAIVTLFKTSHTCCNDCNMNEETSYTGGTVKLFAGDIIKIKISGHGLAFYDGNSSFAGMIMTGEED